MRMSMLIAVGTKNIKEVNQLYKFRFRLTVLKQRFDYLRQ
jgi:hypothetical protein